MFDAVYVLTEGGPGHTTETLSLYAYKTLMRAGSFGYGSALSVVTFRCVASLGLVWLRLLAATRRSVAPMRRRRMRRTARRSPSLTWPSSSGRSRGSVVTSLWPDAELTRVAAVAAHARELRRRAARAAASRRAIVNSLLVAGATTLACLALAAPAAFALAKLRFPGGRAAPRRRARHLDVPAHRDGEPALPRAPRASGCATRSPASSSRTRASRCPLALWLLTGIFRDLPDELYRAARVDGCTPAGRVPARAPPARRARARDDGAPRLRLRVERAPLRADLHTRAGAAHRAGGDRALRGEHREPWGEIAAASMLATVPVSSLVAVLFQRRIVAGLTAGAVKG